MGSVVRKRAGPAGLWSDGILFIDRLDKEQRKLALKEIRSADWAGMPGPIIRDSPHANPTLGAR